ncbi:MAG: hypothetical protein L6364_04135, partial [Desulfobulbaceae bacterium]|nr:hypothetical protein [Desulfobulbaceae bacterium]
EENVYTFSHRLTSILFSFFIHRKKTRQQQKDRNKPEKEVSPQQTGSLAMLPRRPLNTTRRTPRQNASGDGTPPLRGVFY